MKILHINDIASVGYNLVKGLRGYGITAYLLTLHSGTLTTSSEISQNDYVIKVNKKNKPTATIKIFRYLLKFKDWDLVHIHYVHNLAYLTNIVLGIRDRRPIIIHVHGSDIKLAFSNNFIFRYLHRPIKAFLLKKASAVLVSTPNLLSLVKILSSTKPVYFPSPVDVNLFSPVIAKRLSSKFEYLRDGYDYLISIVSSINFRDKGSDLVIRALAKLNEKNKLRNVGIVTIKSGKDLSIFNQLATKLGIKDKIKYLPTIPHSLMPGLYGISDIVIASISPRYVFSVSALESMACRVPTINTWSRKYYDIKLPYIPRNTVELSNFIELLLENHRYRRKIADLEYDWVIRNHSLKYIVPKLICLYSNLIEQERRSVTVHPRSM